jgi:hypothetical protein
VAIFVVKGLGAIQIRRVHQAHEGFPRPGVGFGLVEQGILPVHARPLDDPLANRIIQWGQRFPQEYRQFLRVF